MSSVVVVCLCLHVISIHPFLMWTPSRAPFELLQHGHVTRWICESLRECETFGWWIGQRKSSERRNSQGPAPVRKPCDPVVGFFCETTEDGDNMYYVVLPCAIKAAEILGCGRNRGYSMRFVEMSSLQNLSIRWLILERFGDKNLVVT